MSRTYDDMTPGERGDDGCYDEEDVNVPCIGCNGTDMPLHTDGRCPNCHELDDYVDTHGSDWWKP